MIKESTAKKGNLAYAVNNGEHKQDWATPWTLYYNIEDTYNIQFKIDVCATKENAKCEKYITPEMDFFKTEVYDDAFMNPKYELGNLEEGVYGIGHFVARLYHQHIYHNINVCYVLPSTVTSLEWFETYFGKRLLNAFGDKAEPYFVRKRQNFQQGKTNGGPPFSTQVFLHRRHTDLEMQQIQRRYEENKDKLVWYLDDRKL